MENGKKIFVSQLRYKLAWFLSFLGHPLLMGTFLSSLVFYQIFPPEKALLLSGFILLLVSLPASAWIYYKTQSGGYSNFDVSVRSQRKSMYLVLTGLLGTASFLAWQSEQPLAFCIGLSLCLGMVLLSFLLNTFLKTSLHAAMSFFMAVGLLQLHFVLGVGLLLLAVLVGISRLVLKRHSLAEVISGSVVGAAAGLLLIYLLPVP